MIVVVDYHKGNLLSVERGLVAAGASVQASDDPAVIAQADALVLPGVGAFADAAQTMLQLGQTSVIRSLVEQGVPFLGICLGMHLMFEEGIEGAPETDTEQSSNNAQGLAILPGVVGKLPHTDMSGTTYKIPHVGWNTVQPYADASQFSSPLFHGIDPGEYFYFTHSYCAPDGPFAIGQTTHARPFISAVQYKDHAFGVQFHPEKSSDAGALLLKNFVHLAQTL